MKKILKVASYFAIEGTPIEAVKNGNGLINDTYLVKTSSNSEYIIQRINTKVFRDPLKLMQNIYLVSNHINKLSSSCNSSLVLILGKDGQQYCEYEGNYYRCYQYLANTFCVNSTKSFSMLYEAGKCIGRFQSLLANFDPTLITDPIVDFHNTKKRYERLISSYNNSSEEKKLETASIIKEIIAYQNTVGVIIDGLENGLLPLRVTHNDTKLNNIMFDKVTKKAKCLIDLDTVMQGSALFDYGDALRIVASKCAEDETDHTKVGVNVDSFIVFTIGYLEAALPFLTNYEITLLVDSISIITLECGMRFLTDYLEGNHYFHIEYDKHNLDRAVNQIMLANCFKKEEVKLKKIVEELRIRLLMKE